MLSFAKTKIGKSRASGFSRTLDFKSIRCDKGKKWTRKKRKSKQSWTSKRGKTMTRLRKRQICRGIRAPDTDFLTVNNISLINN